MSANSVHLSAQDVLMEQILTSRSFARLDKTGLKAMVKRIEMLPVRAGEAIFRQGEAGDCFYIIGAGQCRVFNYPAGGGAAIEIATLGPGDTFGEDSLIRGTPRGASIEMLTDGTLACLHKADFEKLIKGPLLQGVGIEEAQSMMAYGACMIDPRSPAAFAKYAVPGSRNVPLNKLRQERRGFDKQVTYITVSDQELESALAAFLLAQKGLEARYLTAPVADYIRHCAKDDADTFAMLGGSEIESIIELPEEYLLSDEESSPGVQVSDTPAVVQHPSLAPKAESSDSVNQLRLEFTQALNERDQRHREEMHKLRMKVRALLAQYQNRIVELERRLGISASQPTRNTVPAPAES
jgi:rhodanese-related sulfurtransferase